MESDQLTLLKHTKPLHHQVGGHVHDDKNKEIGFLECGDGTILKLLQNKGRGDREVSFYRSVYDPSCTNPVLLQLRPLLPTFFGVLTSPHEPNATYMRLEDVAAGFRCPCIVDIKMGARTYDPLADPEKMAREDAKYPPAKKIGFQIRGMRIYCGKTDTFKNYGKEYLRTFTEETIEDALGMFFTNGEGLRKGVIEACLKKLQPIVEWFQKQKEISFYSSSILIVYEGAEKPIAGNGPIDGSSGNYDLKERDRTKDTSSYLEKPSNFGKTTLNSNQSEKTSSLINPFLCNDDLEHVCEDRVNKDIVKASMIDFTHVFPLNGLEKDENYFLGLQNLVKYCQGLLAL